MISPRPEVIPIEHVLTRPRVLPRVSRAVWLTIAFLAAALLSLFYLGQTSDIAASGYDIARLQEQKQTLEMQNEQLRLQVAQLQSLDRIDREASSRLHMGPPEREVFVSAPPISIPTPPPSPTPLSGETEQHLRSLWSSLEADLHAVQAYLFSR